MTITVGMTISSAKRRREIPGGEEARWGVVVEVLERIDPDTGEVAYRYYRVTREDPGVGWRWDLLDADELDEDADPEPPNEVLLRDMWQRMAKDVAGRRADALQEARLVWAMGRLMQRCLVDPWPAMTPGKPCEPRPEAPVNVAALVD